MATPEDTAKQALEAAKRSEALLSQIAQQLNQQSEVLKSQAEAQVQTTKQINRLQTDLSFKVAPSRASKIKNESIKRHAEPLEQVQNICSSSSAALAGHISGEDPLFPEQVESIKNNLDEGERLCEVRLRYHKDCDRKGIDVADEILLIKSEGERDPSELAVEKEALKRVEKRKAEFLAAKGDHTKGSEQKTKGKSFTWTQPPPFNPIPAFIPQLSMFPSAKRPPFQAYSSFASYPGVSSQFNPPNPYSSIPGYNPFGASLASSASAGPGGSKKTFQGPCWTCQQPGHRSTDCPMAASIAANAGKFSMSKECFCPAPPLAVEI
jgi:hypothetical protein